MPITASSCLDLFNDGVVDNGPYTVNVPGVGEIEVYCDMTTPPGGWTQIYDQEDPVYLPTSTWATGVNTSAPVRGQYSILHLIDEINGAAGGFEFYIDWPEDGGGTGFVRWSQPDNPFDSRSGASIDAQFPTNQGGCTPFSGLGNDGGTFSTLNGSDTIECQWWAIGTSTAYGPGIPAYLTSDAPGAGGLIATRTRLWLR